MDQASTAGQPSAHGTAHGLLATTASAAVPIGTGSDGNFTMVIDTPANIMGAHTVNTYPKKFTFNLNENSHNYIRKVFNTDPTMILADKNYNGTNLDYFLGETFDVNVEKVVSNISS